MTAKAYPGYSLGQRQFPYRRRSQQTLYDELAIERLLRPHCVLVLGPWSPLPSVPRGTGTQPVGR